MKSLYAGIYNETQKIFLKKKTAISFILAALIVLISATGIGFLQNKASIFVVNAASFPTLLLSFFTNFFLPLFIFSLAADVFAGEVGEKTLKLTLTRPISRFKVFAAKNISLGIYIALNLGIIFIISLCAGLFLNSANTQGLEILQALLAYMVAIVPMLTLSIFAVFIAQFFQSSSSALTTSIFIYLGAKILPLIPFFTAKIARVILFSYTDWHTLWLGNSLAVGKIANIFLLLSAYSIIFFH